MSYNKKKYTIRGIVAPENRVVRKVALEARRSSPPYSIAIIDTVAATGIPDRTTNTPSISSSVMRCLNTWNMTVGITIIFMSIAG